MSGNARADTVDASAETQSRGPRLARTQARDIEVNTTFGGWTRGQIAVVLFCGCVGLIGWLLPTFPGLWPKVVIGAAALAAGIAGYALVTSGP